ncbi:MAG TPA: argininosuccinate lyase [Clostridiales bacterium]|nr:argininosuccinate lyase [Clostridiales bacterium]
MSKLWAGRADGKINQAAEAFNSSIRFDKRLFREDITGSIAHAAMLGKQGIISQEEMRTLIAALGEILSELAEGKLAVDESAEDIHTFVEQTLVDKVGPVGKKLHTARSRNDQVALDMKLFARSTAEEIKQKVLGLTDAIINKAEEYKGAVMSGYTHLQRAQPVTFGHHLMAYAFMLLRDADRLTDAVKRLNLSPIGAAALAGTTYPTDRFYEAELLSFDGVTENSIDSVSDRDYLVELLSALSLLMTHLSRLSEELVLWSSFEFKYVEISDDFTTGSSIMPQKKNPDMAELCRGKTGRVYGDLITLLTVLKGLPLAYNKDMQEDKECFFDAADTVSACLDVFTPMIASLKANPQKMLDSAKEGFINATDIADYLAKKGVPFREAYQLVGKIVHDALQKEVTLEEIPLTEYQKISPLFEEDLYEEIALQTCVNKRTSYGGTALSSVKKQIQIAREKVLSFAK